MIVMLEMKTQFVGAVFLGSMDDEGEYHPITILTSYGEITGTPFEVKRPSDGPLNQIQLACWGLQFVEGADPFNPYDKRLLHLKNVTIVGNNQHRKNVNYMTVFADQIIGVLANDEQ